MRLERWQGVAAAVLVLGLGGAVRRRSARSVLPRAAAGPIRLVEASKAAGLNRVHEPFRAPAALANVAPLLAAMSGASAAVADVDGDGRPDVYLTSSALGSENALYRNNGDGTFTDVAERWGVADVNQAAGSLRALFFDFDNDGRRDLLLTTTHCPRFFRNTGRRFVDVTREVGLIDCGYAHAANALDYDGDGFLDLVIAAYYRPIDLAKPDNSRFMFNRLVGADNGGPILVYHNEAGRGFRRVPDALGIKSRGWTHAVGVYGLSGAHRPDLFFATDFNKDQLYFADGRGRYEDASRLLGDKYLHFGMSAEAATLGDGRPSVYVTDIFDPGHSLGANRLWSFGPGGRPAENAARLGISRCGWSWGAKFVDLDNDGRLDLVVANGMLSADPETDYWYRLGVLESGTRALWEDASLWPAFAGASWAGYQSKCVFRNAGDRFEDVSSATPLGSDRFDGRAVAVIDVLSRGEPALVMPAVAGRARLYVSRPPRENGWLGLTLVGRRSNRDGWGALVTVVAGGRSQTAELEPANGFQSQSDGRLLFGLGPARAAESVLVRWPSGTVQRLSQLSAGRYHVIEEASRWPTRTNGRP